LPKVKGGESKRGRERHINKKGSSISPKASGLKIRRRKLEAREGTSTQRGGLKFGKLVFWFVPAQVR